MKKVLKTLFVISVFLTISTLNAFANNTNSTMSVSKYITESNGNSKAHAYIEKSKLIREEINNLTITIKNLKEYNSKVNAKLKELNEKYKTYKNVISSDVMKQIKELRKSIQTTEMPEKTVSEDDSIKSMIQNKEYDRALAKLNETLEHKKEQLKTLQERNAIWHQIDALIG